MSSDALIPPTPVGTDDFRAVQLGDAGAGLDPGGAGGGAVDSVNGETGVVVLDAEDVGAPRKGEPAPYLGLWDALTAYVAGDCVRDFGGPPALWQALTATTGDDPGSSLDQWAEVAQPIAMRGTLHPVTGDESAAVLDVVISAADADSGTYGIQVDGGPILVVNFDDDAAAMQATWDADVAPTVGAATIAGDPTAFTATFAAVGPRQFSENGNSLGGPSAPYTINIDGSLLGADGGIPGPAGSEYQRASGGVGTQWIKDSGTLGDWVQVITAGSPVPGYTPIVFTAARAVADAVTTDNDATLESASAAFVAGDVGSFIVGAGIPDETTILSVTSETEIEMSAQATVTATDVHVSITEPEPASLGPGTIWLRHAIMLDPFTMFGTAGYQLRIRDASDGFWNVPAIISADDFGAVRAMVIDSGEGFEMHARSSAGVSLNVVGVSSQSAFLGSYHEDGVTIAGEVTVHGNTTTVRHTNAAGDEVQEIVADNAGVHVVTSAPGGFTYNGAEVMTV